MNENRAYSDEELLTEIFGFFPKRLLDEFYDNMNIIFGKMAEGMGESLKKLSPGKESEINQVLHDFALHCEVELDGVYNTFQQYMYSNIWKIPQDLNVLPEHYKELELNASEENHSYFEEEVEALKKQIVAQKIYQKVISDDILKKEKELEELNQYERTLSDIISLPNREKYHSPLELIRIFKHHLDELKQSTIASIMTTKEVAMNIKDSDARSSYLRSSLKRQLDAIVLPQAKRNKQDQLL